MAGNEERDKKRVCVTGAGGYVGSWVVKSLLSKGYLVHGTVRDPCDEKKNGHLEKMEFASENLNLFKADLFDYEGLCGAISGCTGVIHVASPVPSTTTTNPEVELVEPAITGTRNVLNACLNAKVKKLVIISSICTIWHQPNWPKDKPMDETCWTDINFCKNEMIAEEKTRLNVGYTKTVEMCYCLGKTMAEQEALESGRVNEIKVVTVCPSIIIGPMLQSTINSSSLFFMSLLNGGSVEDQKYAVVDVRDVAKAAILVYEKPESEGRYLCTSYDINALVFVEKIQKMNIIPNYHNYPKEFTNSEEQKTYSSKKLQDLGWTYESLDQTIIEGIHNLVKLGLLPKA